MLWSGYLLVYLKSGAIATRPYLIPQYLFTFVLSLILDWKKYLSIPDDIVAWLFTSCLPKSSQRRVDFNNEWLVFVMFYWKTDHHPQESFLRNWEFYPKGIDSAYKHNKDWVISPFHWGQESSDSRHCLEDSDLSGDNLLNLSAPQQTKT